MSLEPLTMAASAVGDATKGVYFDNLGVPQECFITDSMLPRG